jgi:5-methylcytosine-specific restriction endonuclease McrA
MLLEKYVWIQDYVSLIDAHTGYSDFRKTHKGRQQEARRNYFVQFNDSLFFQMALTLSNLSINEAASTWDKAKTLIWKIEVISNAINGLVQQKFSYEFLNKLTMRGELVERLGVFVCPYCNQQYIYFVSDLQSPKYLGDLDHVLPKSAYQLFSASLWNLVPCCKSCNQAFKRSSTSRILNPHEGGFDDDCILEIPYHNVQELIGAQPYEKAAWMIQGKTSEERAEQITQNLKVFALDEIYNHDCHRNKFRKILQTRYRIESRGYQKSLQRIHIPFDEQLWYGVSVDPDKFQEEPLSKAIYDIVLRN